MDRFLTLVAASLVGMAPASAFAQTAQPQPAPQQAQQGADPNEMICEKQKAIGSRIATKRICKTRAQWAEDQRVDRMEVEKSQTQLYVKGQ